jgi:hypothetical protein
MSDDVIVINRGLESKTSASGKTRFHIKVISEALAFDLDTKRLVQPVADAMAHHFREQIRNISTQASAATIKAREAAKRALSKGEAWAAKRYAGGRMGQRQPAQSTKLFNDSGRMIESIVATPASDGTFRVNVAANRLDPSTLNGGQGALDRIWARLVQLVPSIQDMSLAMQSDEVLRARTAGLQRMIIKMKASSGAGMLDVLKEAAKVAQNVGGIGNRLAG